MSETDRGFRFLLSATAQAELREMKRRDPDSFDTIIVLLQEIRSDSRSCEQLVNERYFDETIRQVEQFYSAQREGMNVYTVKLYELGRWRIITAGDFRTKSVAILSIMHRDRDYQSDAKLMEQLRADYDTLGFTKIP